MCYLVEVVIIDNGASATCNLAGKRNELQMETYLVGGAVRDEILGLPSKDYDFTVVLPAAGRNVEELFLAMRDELLAQGFKIHDEMPDKFVIRAGVPVGHPLRVHVRDADFVLAREDGPYSDGRRPDWVKPANLEADLGRRDFTVNAIAKDPVTGKLIDPFGGCTDIQRRLLRFVGDPERRIIEDGLRVVRGLRFLVTKGLDAEPATWSWMNSPTAVEAMSVISMERINDEISRMFEFDSIAAIAWMGQISPELAEVIFRGDFHLTGSLKQRKS